MTGHAKGGSLPIGEGGRSWRLQATVIKLHLAQLFLFGEGAIEGRRARRLEGKKVRRQERSNFISYAVDAGALLAHKYVVVESSAFATFVRSHLLALSMRA